MTLVVNPVLNRVKICFVEFLPPRGHPPVNWRRPPLFSRILKVFRSKLMTSPTWIGTSPDKLETSLETYNKSVVPLLHLRDLIGTSWGRPQSITNFFYCDGDIPLHDQDISCHQQMSKSRFWKEDSTARIDP
ncbi:hypothetical protein Dimus_029319 [Dionaea muscipula]